MWAWRWAFARWPKCPRFFLFPVLARRFALRKMIPFFFAYYALEQYLFSVVSHPVLLLGVVMCSGTVFAQMTCCVAAFVHRMAPEGLKATAMTTHGCAKYLATIIGNLICGALIDSAGIRTSCLVIGLMTLAAGIALFLLFSYRDKRRILEEGSALS